MKQLILAITILCIASLACEFAEDLGDDDEEEEQRTADYYMEVFGGSVDVYNRILALSDCAELKSEFDQAEEDAKLQEPGTEQYGWAIGYMAAADDRMEYLECDEDPFKGMSPAEAENAHRQKRAFLPTTPSADCSVLYARLGKRDA